MLLTSSYSRIIARPWNEPCPYCEREIGDWFVEWHEIPDQHKIYQQEAAMDCPYCRRGCSLIGQTVTRANPELPIIKRSLDQAIRWAELNYPSLEAFLTSEDPREQRRAAPFRRGYWPGVRL